MAGRDIWVFAYGSLMWDPGFPFLAREPALLQGYHRAMCIYSHVWRGTPVKPGLVLGLDRGGACRGVALRIAADAGRQVLDYLDARERVTDVYSRRALAVRLGGRRVTAQAYVVDRAHPQYAGRLDTEEAARLIRQGAGRAGANTRYLESAIRHLAELGVRDKALEALARKVGVL